MLAMLYWPLVALALQTALTLQTALALQANAIPFPALALRPELQGQYMHFQCHSYI